MRIVFAEDRKVGIIISLQGPEFGLGGAEGVLARFLGNEQACDGEIEAALFDLLAK